MKLSQLCSRPVLIEITLDDEDTVKEYGEPLTFHTWDRQPMDVFMKLAMATEGQVSSVIGIVKDLILDDTGRPVLADGNMLPTPVLMRAIARVTEALGK